MSCLRGDRVEHLDGSMLQNREGNTSIMDVNYYYRCYSKVVRYVRPVYIVYMCTLQEIVAIWELTNVNERGRSAWSAERTLTATSVTKTMGRTAVILLNSPVTPTGMMIITRLVFVTACWAAWLISRSASPVVSVTAETNAGPAVLRISSFV